MTFLKINIAVCFCLSLLSCTRAKDVGETLSGDWLQVNEEICEGSGPAVPEDCSFISLSFLDGNKVGILWKSGSTETVPYYFEPAGGTLRFKGVIYNMEDYDYSGGKMILSRKNGSTVVKFYFVIK
ncbi:MAG: hypothetical protein NC115_06150 [Bacteroidales bacterium]|nr:hypothetical protein [Bacteroidales bacterium]